MSGLTTMLRAALPAVPVVNRLPGVRRTGDGSLPATVRQRRGVVERDHVAAYAEVCGFATRDVAPLTYPHLLAFPLHLELMTDPGFPFPAIGTVHLENALTQHRAVRIGEEVSVSARAQDLRSHPKGRVFDIVVEVSAGSETLWESTSTYLRVGAGDADAEQGRTFAAVAAGGIPWQLPADLGRRYAAVSGDHNPIHLYPLTARAFGFRRQIAHGMWSMARCLAAMDNRLPEAVTVEVAFKKPIFLPGTVSFGMQPTEDGLEFALLSASSGAPHLLGRTSPA